MTRPRPAPRILLIAALNLAALGSLTAPAVAGIPAALAAALPAGERAGALASVLAVGAVTALVANPMFGALSDRTRGRWGRRVPWILGGAVTGLGAIAGLTGATSPGWIAVWWAMAQLAYNAMMAAAAALLADAVPERSRGAAAGLFTAGAFVGALPPLLLATILPAHVGAVSFVMPTLAVVVALAALTLRDPVAPCPSGSSSRISLRSRVRETVHRIPRSFVAVWVQRFGMQSAFTLTTSFTLYLVVDRMTGGIVAATPVTTLATLVGGAAIVVGSIVGGGWASRRRTYVPFLVLGAVALAAAATARAAATSPVFLWAAALVGGLGLGAYLAVNLALAIQATPPGRAGAYLGLLNVAETLPGVIGPVVAAALLRVGEGDPLSTAGDNYVALYATAAALALASLAAIPAVRGAALAARRAATGDTDPSPAA